MNNNKKAVFNFIFVAGFFLLQVVATASPCFLKMDIYCKSKIISTDKPDSNLLKQALLDFMAKADSGKINDVIAYYDSHFLSVRIVDAGQFIKMDYAQMVGFWKSMAARMTSAGNVHPAVIVTQKTTIHYMEILSDTAYVLMTRIKDLGNGPEPMFYNLVWVNKNNHWYLLREFVHQRTMPNFH
jgi:hypothetical protein